METGIQNATTADFGAALKSVRARTADYRWMLALLRWRMRRSGRFPTLLFRVARQVGNPRRPLFLGRTGSGIQFVGDYRDFVSVMPALSPAYNQGTSDFLSAQAAAGDGAYLDVGTNIGVVAASVARALNGRHPVLCFEPIPATAERACAAFALNGLENVRLSVTAVGDTDGEIKFFDAVGNSGVATAHPHQYEYYGRYVPRKVPCLTLDSLALTYRVGLIKIDVEGHELSVLRGARALLARDRPAVFYEYTPALSREYGWGLEETFALLRAAGPYEFWVVEDSGARRPHDPAAPIADQVNIFAQCPA